MKKNFKLVLALVLSVMMIVANVALAATDQQVAGNPAAQEGTITIKPSSTVPIGNKTLYAYRILDASYSSTGSLTATPPTQAVAYTIPAGMMSFYESYFDQEADAANNIEAKTLAQLAAAANKTVDNYVAAQISAMDTAALKKFEYAALSAAKTNNAAVKKSGAKSGDNYVFSNLEAGYYVIEDEGAATPLSALMLDTVTNANVEITLKASDETEKEILPAGELVNRKADQLGLGRAVDYKITQKIPDPTGYNTYYYIINDTLSAGLTFNPESVIVKVGTKTLTKDVDYKLYYDNGKQSGEEGYDAEIASILNGKTFRIAFLDLIGHVANPSTFTNNYAVDDAVEITYNATVNSDAITGVDPETNTVTVQYSRNPDNSDGGDWDENHPGIPASTTNNPLGEGPQKITDTYTTKITILKQDGSNNNAALPGVEFTLTGTAKDAEFTAWEVFEIDPAGTYWLLKNGKYTTTAPQTEATVEVTTGPAGWVVITGTGTDTVQAAVAAGEPVRVIGSTSYRPYVEATDSAKTRYIIVEPNSSAYADTTTKYSKKTVASEAAADYAVMRSGITGSNGQLSFAQLGAGTYTLSETGILPGYNGLPDITFTINCTLPDYLDNDGNLLNYDGSEDAEWSITVPVGAPYSFTEGTGDNAGTFTITLLNNKGVELPHTGGIGTTIFYIGGSILVLAAAILLITKRRMSSND